MGEDLKNSETKRKREIVFAFYLDTESKSCFRKGYRLQKKKTLSLSLWCVRCLKVEEMLQSLSQGKTEMKWDSLCRKTPMRNEWGYCLSQWKKKYGFLWVHHSFRHWRNQNRYCIIHSHRESAITQVESCACITLIIIPFFLFLSLDLTIPSHFRIFNTTATFVSLWCNPFFPPPLFSIRSGGGGDDRVSIDANAEAFASGHEHFV